MRAAGIALLIAIAAGCVAHRPTAVPPNEWAVALTSARRAAVEGRYADADQTLATFARRNPGSAEARESAYWRALFLLDPANRSGSPRSAVEQLDVYLGDPHAPRAAEARVIRGLAATLDSLSHTLAAARAPSGDRPAGEAPRDRAKEEELQKENQQLKEQLDKANQELERIRRRLAPQKP